MIIGIFAERYHDPTLPSIIDFPKGDFDIKDRERISTYLRNGEILIASPGVVSCLLTCSEKEIIGTSAILTDGLYIWSEEFCHYFEKHHFNIPLSFHSHIITNDYTVPILEDTLRTKLSESFENMKHYAGKNNS